MSNTNQLLRIINKVNKNTNKCITELMSSEVSEICTYELNVENGEGIVSFSLNLVFHFFTI